MVIVRLKGVHSVRVKLASGPAVYHYAWRGGPRLPGAPGSPEFVAAFHEAHTARKLPRTGTLRQAIATYKASAAFDLLSAATKRAYHAHLDMIFDEFGDTPFKVLEDIRFRADALDWRDKMRATPRTADYAMGTFKRLLDHAVNDRGLLKTNVLTEIKGLHKANRSDSIWTADEIAAFNAKASKELRWALALAIHTGLRQGDLCRAAWGMYDGASFTLRTGKTDKRVLIPATPACQALMRTIEKRALVILTPSKGRGSAQAAAGQPRRKGSFGPWTESGLRASFRKTCEAAGVKRTFHDLRRTAATTLMSAGIEAPIVAMIMGWSEDEVQALQRLYVSRRAVVEAVLAQLEKGG